MIDRILTTSRKGRSESREIAGADEYRRVLAETFRLDLEPDEVAGLGLF